MKLILKNKSDGCRIYRLAAVAVLLTALLGNAGNAIGQTQEELKKATPVQLLDLETRLAELLAQYTEFHPEVVGLRQQIRLLEEGRVAALNETGLPPSVLTTNTDGPAVAKISPPSNLRAAPLSTPNDELQTFGQQPSLPSSAAPTSSSSNGVPAMVALLRAATVEPTSDTVAGNAPSELPESVKPTAQTKGGPVFSPLPSDLSPTNQVAKKSSSSPPPEANNSMETLDDKHLLANGDRLSFKIVEDEEEPRALTVMDSGELEVPYIGRFYAVGHSCRDLAKALKRELEKDYYYKATVIVAVDLKARSRGKVYLSGAVRLPGAREIPSDETFTLSKAILSAGGFADFANKNKVKITRKAADGVNEDHITVDVTEILERGRTSADVTLQPGDQIYVPEQVFRL